MPSGKSALIKYWEFFLVLGQNRDSCVTKRTWTKKSLFEFKKSKYVCFIYGVLNKLKIFYESIKNKSG